MLSIVCRRATLSILGAAVLACILPLHLFAATVVVYPSNTVPCATGFITYTSIQAAVNAVSSIPGSTVKLCPGTYMEQVKITSKLTLTGIPGMGAAVILPPSGGLVQNGSDIFGSPVAAQIFVNSPGSGNPVTIERLTVDGTGNDIVGCGAPTLEGIYFQNTYGTITNNVVRNQFQTDYTDFGGCQNGLAINVESLTTSSIVTVSSNSVRAYQKNGITATGAATGVGSAGPMVTISANRIIGLAATAMNWPLTGAAENGVQVGFGATGAVTTNTVNNNIWAQDVFGDTGDAASGILVYASPNISVTNNYVGSAQFGIVPVSDTTSTGCNGAPCGTADNTTITGNNVSGTELYDGIDVCSNANTVKSNIIYGTGEAGIHIDDTCGGTGNNNTVEANTVNEACAGILLGTGTTGNVYGPPANTLNNVTNTTMAGDVCSTGPIANSKAGEPSMKRRTQRPSPYRPTQK
jgi:parallel beta-helix repeat protein